MAAATDRHQSDSSLRCHRTWKHVEGKRPRQLVAQLPRAVDHHAGAAFAECLAFLKTTALREVNLRGTDRRNSVSTISANHFCTNACERSSVAANASCSVAAFRSQPARRIGHDHAD